MFFVVVEVVVFLVAGVARSHFSRRELQMSARGGGDLTSNAVVVAASIDALIFLLLLLLSRVYK